MFYEYLKKININLLKNSNKELIISTSGTTGKKKSIVQPNRKNYKAWEFKEIA